MAERHARRKTDVAGHSCADCVESRSEPDRCGIGHMPGFRDKPIGDIARTAEIGQILVRHGAKSLAGALGVIPHPAKSIDPGELRPAAVVALLRDIRSEEHTSELQSLMRISYAVFCLKKKNKHINDVTQTQ